jgi:acetylornithine/succinyldiaminopimelate/putrescine aminotransferase
LENPAVGQQALEIGIRSAILRLRMAFIPRILAPGRDHFFLLGPRGTSKTLWSTHHYPQALRIDLLDPEKLRLLSARPERLTALVEGNRAKPQIIIDEVQTGFCRTGKWFGFEHAGIQPDAVTFAKGMGNGMPVGALWARRDVAAVLQPGDHGSTYSGTALATSAVAAVISEMKRLDAPALAQKQGARLSNALNKLSKVDHVRGSGLLLGAQLTAGVETKDVVPALLEKGLIVNGVNATTIRLAPPITVSDAEIDEAVALIAEALS